MTNPQNFIPTADMTTLSGLCSASMTVNGNLLGQILRDFPKDKLDGVEKMLAGGASIGIETTVDGRANNAIRVIAIEREGTRHVLATVSMPGNDKATGVH